MARELVAWREAHPRANLTQIEDVVFEAMQRLQARALQQVVLASAVADVAAQPVAERPTCPTCSGRLDRAAASGGRFDQPANDRRCKSIAATPCAPNVEPVFFPPG